MRENNPRVLYYAVIVAFLILIITVFPSKINLDELDIWDKRVMFYAGALIVSSWIGIMIHRLNSSLEKIGSKHVWSKQQFIVFSFVTILTIWVVFTPLFGLEVSMLFTGIILLWVYYWSGFVD